MICTRTIAVLQGFDILHDQPSCPMCHTEFKARKPGFNNCWWRIPAIQKDGTSVRVPYRRAENNYTTYGCARVCPCVCMCVWPDNYADCRVCLTLPDPLVCSYSFLALES